MSAAIVQPEISAIVHLPKAPPYKIKSFYNTLHSVLSQMDDQIEIIILDEKNDKSIEDQIRSINTEGHNIEFIRGNFSTAGQWLNAAYEKAGGHFLLYIDNSAAEVILRDSACVSLAMVMERNPDCAMVYSDYEIETDGQVREIHLLKHHTGRVRDNQDYGRVFYFRRSALAECSGFDHELKFSTMYDMRLRISGQSKILHLSNRYSGSLYRVLAAGKGHNVFDYLLASKESQIEAEEVLTRHLRQIGAYLAPGNFYHQRPKSSIKPELQATIIIPVNNRANFIGTAIESVLNQTVREVEVIIAVNGGPHDPTIPAVRAYMPGGAKFDEHKPRVRLLVLDINNIGLCLNMGAKAARGKYYVQLDSDDRLKPEAVEKILAVYESDDKIGMVIGSYEVWQLNDADGKITRVESIPVVTHDEWTEDNGRNNLLRINGAGAPRSIPINIIQDIGYFGINDEPFARNYGEDYEMVLKISEKYRIGRVWEPIYDVVRHSGGTDHSIDQVTIDRNDEAKDYMREQAIKRRQKLNNA